MPTSTITPQESTDLLRLSEAKTAECHSFSAHCIRILSMSDSDLKHAGHATIADALHATTRAHKNNINRLVLAHIRKYPD